MVVYEIQCRVELLPSDTATDDDRELETSSQISLARGHPKHPLLFVFKLFDGTEVFFDAKKDVAVTDEAAGIFKLQTEKQPHGECPSLSFEFQCFHALDSPFAFFGSFPHLRGRFNGRIAGLHTLHEDCDGR